MIESSGAGRLTVKEKISLQNDYGFGIWWKSENLENMRRQVCTIFLHK